jgi:hypothetical protein
LVPQPPHSETKVLSNTRHGVAALDGNGPGIVAGDAFRNASIGEAYSSDARLPDPLSCDIGGASARSISPHRRRPQRRAVDRAICPHAAFLTPGADSYSKMQPCCFFLSPTLRAPTQDVCDCFMWRGRPRNSTVIDPLGARAHASVPNR